VVDLAQVRALDELGITLDATSPSADATVKVASQAGRLAAFRMPVTLRWTPGSRLYLPLPRGTRARYAQLTVYSGTGAPVCVGSSARSGRIRPPRP